MLNVGALREGYVLDHIKAGKAMTIYHDRKYHQGRKDRCKERAEAAEAGCERDQMQESSLHYFHRAGTGSDFCSCR